MATSFRDGGSRCTRREPPTMGKQLLSFITCGCESSAPFLQIAKPGANPRVLVICFYELLDPTTSLIEPPGPRYINMNSY